MLEPGPKPAGVLILAAYKVRIVSTFATLICPGELSKARAWSSACFRSALKLRYKLMKNSQPLSGHTIQQNSYEAKGMLEAYPKSPGKPFSSPK